MKAFNQLIVILALAIISASCDIKKSNPLTLINQVPTGSEQLNTPDDLPLPDEPVVAPEEQLITFVYLKKTALVSCDKCHNPNYPKKLKLLRTHEEFVKSLASVAKSIRNDRMPKTNSGEFRLLNECEKALLDRWVEAGAPIKTDIKVYDVEICRPVKPPPVVTPPPDEPPPVVEFLTFSYLQKTSLQTCKECHTEVEPGDDKPLLTNREEFIAHLDKVMEEVTSGLMPPVEEGYSPLTDCEKSILARWVVEGTPEVTDIDVKSIDKCGPVDQVISETKHLINR